MKTSLTKLMASTLLSGALVIPHVAFAREEWRKDLSTLNNTQVLRSLQVLVEGPQFPPLNVNNPADRSRFGQKLTEKMNELQKEVSQEADLGGTTHLVQYSNGTLKLLDFVVGGVPVSPSNRNPIAIPETRSLKAWGIDRFQMKDFGVENYFDAKVQPWEKSSPVMSKVIKNAISKVPVYVLDYEIVFKDNKYFFPSQAKTAAMQGLVTGAIYLKDYGVLISKKYFARLDFDNQVGVLSHAALQHIQLTYGFGNSEKSVQQLNVALMRGPRGAETLDSAEFVDGKILLNLIRRTNFEIRALLIIPKACDATEKVFHKSCGIKDLSYNSLMDGHKFLMEDLLKDYDSLPQRQADYASEAQRGLLQLAAAAYNLELEGMLVSAMDSSVSLGKAVEGSVLDVISKDYNESRFFSRYKTEARPIIDGLKSSNVIR